MDGKAAAAGSRVGKERMPVGFETPHRTHLHIATPTVAHPSINNGIFVRYLTLVGTPVVDDGIKFRLTIINRSSVVTVIIIISTVTL